VVLVGHSYGGTLITHAGTDNRVAALVYIAALAPDADETSQSQQQKFPVTDVFSHIEVADGRIWLKPDGIGYFAGDLPEAEQKLVWATQAGPVPDLFTQKVDGVAWRSKPSWYVVATEDRTVHPDLERFVAKRMGATTVEAASSHVPMTHQGRGWAGKASQGRERGSKELAATADRFLMDKRETIACGSPCPLSVKSGHQSCSAATSALPPEADVFNASTDVR
jgi:pimeloyl-ACP methyl ester carboxylesterase